MWFVCFYALLCIGSFLFSIIRRHTRCTLLTGVQTCALPICCPVPHAAPARSSLRTSCCRFPGHVRLEKSCPFSETSFRPSASRIDDTEPVGTAAPVLSAHAWRKHNRRASTQMRKDGILD